MALLLNLGFIIALYEYIKALERLRTNCLLDFVQSPEDSRFSVLYTIVRTF
jgi:hypothetical protein